jgi:hypothetical protein
VEVEPTGSPVEGRPSLRPLALVLGALGVLWLTAFALILVQLA